MCANQLDQLLLEMLFLNKWSYTASIFMQIQLQFGLGLCQALIIAFGFFHKYSCQLMIFQCF